MSEHLLQDLSPEQRRLLVKRLRQMPAGDSRFETHQRASVAVERIPARSHGSGAPLSFGQQRLWFLSQLAPGAIVYNLAAGVELEGRFKVPVLAAAINEIVRRHEALRTNFVLQEESGEPVQRIVPRLRIDLPVIDLRALPPAVGQSQAAALGGAIVRQPYDLARGPLLRVFLLRLDGERYALVMGFHHIVSDGWSFGIFVRELLAHYQAFAQRHPAALPDLPIQYADFALWQRERLQGELLDRELAWWKERLAGAPTALELPTDRPRPPARSFQGGSVPFAIPGRLSESLSGLGQQSGATLFMTLLAAFDILVWRCTGREDFLVGTPIAGRERVELEGLIGFFLNTLSLRMSLAGDPCFRSLLGRVQEVTLAAYLHQELPFERLVAELQPEREPSRTPLFQVMFILQNAPKGTLRVPGLVFRPFHVEMVTAQFDLTFVLEESPGGVGGSARYNRELFDATTVQRWVGHFVTLLEEIELDPDRPVARLSLLSPAERHQLLAEWNATRAPLLEGACLHGLIEAQVERTPDAVALACDGELVTYGELERSANRLARRLVRLGGGPEVRVALALPRSPAMVAALLAVGKSGGAYVPLDPAHPAERLALIIAEARPQVLVTVSSLQSALPETGARVLCLDTESAWIERQSPAPFDARSGGESLAYTIFTSGSTGRPKGVSVPHRALVNFLLSMAERPGLGERDVLLAVTTLSFDIAALELLLPLAVGARIVLARREEAIDGSRLVVMLAESAITVLQGTPATWQMLLDAGWPGDAQLVALCGGEALPVELAQRLLPRVGALWNLYGPTETTVWSAVRPVREVTGGMVSIGGPIANTSLHVLDPQGGPAPLGVPGELHIGGAGVARGYLGRPELTAEMFVPDPFAGAAAVGARLYRTGDLARFLPNGEIEYLGRLDLQVKVRGFRIELGEIEAALAACPGVRQAVAVVRQDTVAGKSLVAYAVPAAGAALDPGHLRVLLRGRLPDYMVPGAVVVLESLPLTPNGKIDRRALPESAVVTTEMPVGPRTPFEELLAAIFAEVLRVEQVGVEASFFDLGGHSLLATQLVSRIRETFGVEVPLPVVFESPTVAGLARAVEKARRSGEVARVPRIEAVPRSAALPLSFAQQRLWFLDQLQPGSPAYNLPVAVQLAGPLAFAAFSAAITEVVRRHEVLRTTFDSVAGEPRQMIAPGGPVAMPRVDLSGLAAADRDTEARRLARGEARRPFDLEKGPLMRVLLVEMGEEDRAFLLTLHHIISDGWSMALLVREIGACYEAFSAGRPPLLPELEVQYADYAVWQRRWLSRDVLDAELDYWRRQLEGAPSMLDLPTDRPRPAIQTFRGASSSFALPGALSQEIQGLARRQRATLYMALLASYQTLLSRYSGQLDISIGTPIAGRGHLQTENLIGCFVNTLVLRTDLSGDPSFLELLQRVKRVALEAFTHPDLQFEKLVDELQPERDLSHTPLFQAVFSFQNWRRTSVDLPGLTLRPVEADSGTAKFDLILFMEERSGGLRGSLQFNTDLFDATTIARLAGHLEVLLDGVARAPEERLSGLPLLREEERAQIVGEWNDTALAHPRVLLLHELFEESVRWAPASTAVVSAGTQISYAELNRRANQLAHHLRALDVGPGKPVAVLLDRSAEMVVALLGIAKSGGAYVPLETRAPVERMQWILDTLGIAVLVGGSSRLASIAEISQGLAGLRHVVCLDQPGGPVILRPTCGLSLPADLARQPEHDPERIASAEDLAYIIFTSGSTGRPKGVMVRHRPAFNLIDWVNRSFAVGPADRVLFITSLGFDLSVYDVFGLLAAGGSIRVASREELENPDLLARTLATEPITLWDSAPAALQQLVPLLPQAVASGDGGTLRLVLLSGDWIPLALPDQVRASFPGARVVALGGATEATVWSNFYPVGAVDPLWKSVPYGRPIQNARYYVLDGAYSPCPIGVPGDLYIGGGCLSDGYSAAPLLTARQYLPDPFAGQLGAVMYRTGDRARFSAGGTIEFLGRLDAQVKIRGFRIELGEIEVSLLEHPAVREAVALVREDRPGDRQLVAYVVPEEGESAAAGELRAFLRERLPEYMVPAAFVILAAMPVTANGKLDRKALPAPEQPGASAGAGFVAPRTAAEEVLAGIWRDVLRRDQVSVDANFFELGGDSILSIQVVSRAARAGLSLTPRQLFENPTVAGLAAVAGTAGDESLSEVITGPVPLTPIQRWFFAQELPCPEHFNQALLLEIWPPEGEARVDPALLRRAVAGLLAHHTALSLRFEPPAADRPEWWQVSGAVAAEPPFTRIDLAALPEGRRRAALEEATAGLQASLDLTAGPLLRVALFGHGKGTAERLLLIAHHLVVDGVSWRILLEDLEILYRQLARVEEMSLLPPTASFQRWAERLAEYAASPAAEAEGASWLARLSRPPAPLPINLDGADDSVAAARSVTALLTAEETRALLQEVPRAYHTRIDDVLLAALAEACAGWTGSRRLLVDLEGHGRGDLSGELDLSRTVGWFTTLTPVLLDLEGVAGPGEALKSVKEQLRAVQRAGAAHSLPRSLPRAEVIFNYLGQLDQAVAPRSLFRPAVESSGPARDARQPRAHLLEINGGVSGGQLRMGLRYSERRHRRETVEALAGRFVAALRGFIAHCLSPEAGGFTPSDFPLAGLGQEQLDRLTAGRRIEDLYPASPVQQGMLFHTLQAPGSGVYVEQVSLTLGGELDAAAFAHAWQRLVARHTILRTSFVWEGVERPLQVVHPEMVLAWAQDDWSALSSSEQRERWAACLAADRSRGFDLTRAPLSRWVLIRVGEEGYRFLWSHHHVLLDGWSLPLLLHELFALYEGELKGVEVRLAPVRPYRDYVEWLEGQDLAAAEAFWRRSLAGFTAPTPLPIERSAVAPATSHGMRQASLPADRAEALRAFGRRHQLTVNTVVQGAWAILLQRYSGEDDVVFGAVTSGRSAPVAGIEAMVGLFINTLPVRVSGPARLQDWLEGLQERQAEARQYEHAPLSRIQGWSQVPRGWPLFESIVAFESYPVDRSVREQAGRSLHIGEAEAREQTNYPLTVDVIPGVRLAVHLHYDRRRFEAAAVERLLQHFMTLLEGMLADPGREREALQLLAAAERHQILAEWNDTDVTSPQDVPLHARVEIQAARTPDAPAATCEGETLTYAELSIRMNRLARHLRRLGCGPESRVAVAMERTLDLLVSFLGVLKAGAAYVPLDPEYPRGRLAFLLENSRPAVVLTQESLQGRLPIPNALPVIVPAVLPADEEIDSGELDEIARDRLAYIIYTSGSTGRPKGAMVVHAGMLNHLLAKVADLGLEPRSRVAQTASPCFDISVWQLVAPLLAGGSVHFASESTVRDPELLLRFIAHERITVLEVVPSLLGGLLDSLAAAGGTIDLSCLRWLIVTGEACAPDLARRWLRLAPHTRLLNAYGPTECSDDVTHYVMVGSELGPSLDLPIGRPIANTRIYLRDSGGEPVVQGVAGELCVAGRGVGRGYFGLPERTAQAFVPDSWSGEPGSRQYRTGDLARWLPDGTLEFLGRLDAQVKIRGFRIELGEIEVSLLEHPAVRAAAALVREDRPGDRRLVAYVVLESGEAGAPTTGELRAFLKERLSEYMVPAAFMVLAAMPVTANGKLDRKALPAPAPSDAGAEGAFVAPRNAAEEILAGIWRDVLRLDRVSVEANFFELGGDSILSIQVISRAARAGLSLTPRQLFEQPTVAGLAAVAGVYECEVGPMSEVIAGPVPLTPIQRWFFAQELPCPEHFNQALLLEMWPPEEGTGIDPALLQRAVAVLLEHHSALSLRFEPPAADRPEWRQVSGAAATVPPFTRLDLAALPEGRRRAALEEAAAGLQASLDLTAGPLLRVALFGQGEGRAERLLLIAHHLVVDGVSWRILLEDLETLYRQLARGETMALLPRATSFHRWAERLAEYAASPAAEAAGASWLERLFRPPSPLPVDLDGADDSVAAARSVTAQLTAEETRALLQEVPRAYRTRIDDVLLAALAEACAGWTGSRRLLVDLEGHGRGDLSSDLDLSRTVGWFTTLTPVLLDLEGIAGPGEALKSVKEQLRAVQRSGAAHGLPRSLPRAEVIFNYLGQLDQAVALKSLFRPAAESSGPARDAQQPRAHLLEINGGVSGGRLWMGLRYSERRHRRETIEALAGRFAAALRGFIAHCLSPEAGGFTPSDFPLAGLSQTELDRLTAGRQIEDLYPASPVQLGMFFHTLQAPGSGVYVEQLSLTLGGELNATAFECAWQRLVARQPILRTSFVWEGVERPLQVVHSAVVLPWEQDDWSALSPAEQRERWAAYLAADRSRGFDLDAAPLLRCALMRVEDGYRFLWSHHHVLLDGWSLPLLLHELFAFYEGELKGEEVRLAPVRPYRDYIAWLESQDLAAAEAFWRQALAGFTAPTPLPIERSVAVPAAAAEAGQGMRQASLPADRAEALRAFGRRHQLTVNTLVQGAWAALLQRYSGEDDVVFGAVTSGRSAPVPGIETMVGLFINTLPVRLSGSAPLAALLVGLQEGQAEARQYEHTPLSRVQGWSQVPRDRPLFESILAFENYPVDRSVRERASRSLHIGEAETIEQTNYPLTVIAMPGVRLAVHLLYDRRRFEAVAVERLLQHFMALLEDMLADPEREPAALPLLAAAERHQILAEWNDTAAPFPAEMLLHHLIERQAARIPEAVAVVCEGRSLTYAELDVRTNRLARHLHRLGVGPDVPVGLCAERSPALLVGLLGVLKAGGAYVPLDPTHPQERLGYILTDAGIPVLVTERALLDTLPPHGARVVLLDQEIDDLRLPLPVAHPENLAYVIYTSGSTGRPKGVGVNHLGVVNYLSTMAARPGLVTGDVMMAVTTLSFDIAVTELLLPLSVGARIELVRRETAGDAVLLAEALESAGATCIQATPATWMLLVEGGWKGRDRLKALCGGEALPRALAEKLLSRVGELWNVYGPTETTVWSTRHRVEPGERQVSLGLPLGNTTIHLLGRQGELVPLGAVGELLIGGAGLARGYHGRPDLTAERFVPDPFGEPGSRLYRTGDLARRQPEGALEYLGRIDFQVKVRGFRIELGEIEAVLVALTGVREAVVVPCEDRSEGPNGRRLVAYVAGEVAVAPDAAGALRRSLRERLPDYMVPAVFVMLPALPLTPNGKVDRKALPAPEWQGREESHLAPRTPVEEVLAGIWVDLLGVEQVGVADHFFDLGGHSLLATRVMSRLRSVFGVEMPLRDLFEAPVLADLAARIEAARIKEDRRTGSVRPAPPLVPLAPTVRQRPLPLSFAQQRLWFIDQLEPGSPLYNMPVALRVEGPLHAAVLALCLGEIVRRHEALRTVFGKLEDAPVQVIQPAAPFTLPVVDLSALPEARREAQALALAGQEASRSFDLARGPLLRGVLLRLAEEDHVAALTMHHIVSDGWSMGILVREVSALYAAFSESRPSPLPELPVQYADFSAWQRSWLHGEVLEGEISFWRRQLAGLPPRLELPVDRPRPAVQSFRGASRPVRLPSELTRKVQALGRREGATLFMVLLAGFQALLARYSGQQDLAVGSPIAGRNRMEIEGLIGFFVNTLVLRGDLTGGPSFRTLLGRVRETALAAHTHQDVPFEKLVEELSPGRSLAQTPLFQVLFVLQNVPVQSLEVSNLRLRPVGGRGTTSKFDLTLGLQKRNDELVGAVEHATDLFDTGTVDRLVGHFKQLLAAAVATPELSVAELPLLTASERHQLIREWSDTATSIPREATVHGLFAEQAERRPAAVALEQGGDRLTYGELQQRAERLARRLVALGLRPEERVAVLGERSPDLIAALLGILQAGGVYLPLDPAHPPERLAWMIRDAGASLLVAPPSSAQGIELAEGLRLVTLDGEEPEVDLPKVPAEALAYVMYTSGSTGTPKGVAVTHRNVVRLVRGVDYVDLGPDQTWLQYAPVSFDASTLEIWAPLLNGGRLVLFPGRIGSLDDLAQVVETHSVTSAWLTAGLFHEMVDGRLEGLQPLSQLLSGGDVVSPEHARRVLEAHPGLTLIDGYGPTEGTTFTCCHRMTDAQQVGENVPIGRPIANTRAYVLDEHLNPVPVGMWGELYAGGDGLARGYLDRPDLTVEHFVPDAFGDGGDRLYRTGDRVRWRTDGTLEFLGRIDHQVKVRGFRIELGEIEAALAALAGVREAVVVVREDRSQKPGDLRLVACVAGDVAVDALREGLRDRLPGYMVPTAFVMLPALPLTPNGKVDRKALASIEPERAAASSIPPRDLPELRIARLFEELLATGPVGAGDDFFALGGHSLLAVRLLARLRQEIGCELPLSVLFLGSTVERLAAAVRSGIVDDSPLVALRPAGRLRPFFLVHPVGGNVLCYAELARLLGPDRPVYGLQANPAGSAEAPGLESMAARYVAEIRGVQPQGPYALGGWSMGGVVAFEMARQLALAGETVEPLVLIDAFAPQDAGGAEPLAAADLVALFGRDLAGLAGRSLSLPDTEPDETAEALLLRVYERGIEAGLLPPDLGAQDVMRFFTVFRNNFESLREYRGGPYRGALLLFCAGERSSGAEADRGWGRWAEGLLEIVDLPAHHYSILRSPAVDELAHRIAAVLDRQGSQPHRCAGLPSTVGVEMS